MIRYLPLTEEQFAALSYLWAECAPAELDVNDDTRYLNKMLTWGTRFEALEARPEEDANVQPFSCPAGMRSADEIRAKLSRIQSLEYRPARPQTFAWGAIWALRWALGEATADRPWIIYCECDDGDQYEADGLGGERR